MRSKVAAALCEFKERAPFMKGLISWVGFKREILSIAIKPRQHGIAKSSPIKMLALALSAMISFSSWPLRVWSILGVFSALLSFSYLSFSIYQKIHNGINIPGYTTIIVLILALGGIQLISIGIIGEYIARIYEASQKRPRYVINEHS